MQHLEQGLEETDCPLIGLFVHRLTVCGLYKFEIPGAEVVPEELVNRHYSVADTVLGIVVFYSSDSLTQAFVEPLDGKFIDICRWLFFNLPHLD